MIKIEKDLLLINICSLLLFLSIIILPDIQFLRIILGLPFLLFFPGYVLLAALFPLKNQLQSATRISLSVGVSVAIGTVIGTFIYQIRHIVGLESVLIALYLFILVMLIISWFQRWKYHRIGYGSGYYRTDNSEHKIDSSISRVQVSAVGKIFLVILIISILGVVISAVYAITNSRPEEQFTEFSILDSNGNADNYPVELVPGEKGQVIANIINHEHQVMEYQLREFADDELISNIGPIQLNDGQEYQAALQFTANKSHVSSNLVNAINEPDAVQQTDTGVTSILIEAADNFNVGDYIRVGERYETRSEVSSIEEIEGNELILSEALKQEHPEGDIVVRVQKVEFILTKVIHIKDNNENYTAVSIYPNGENLDVSIINISPLKATYEIAMQSRSDSGADQQVMCESIEINGGDNWHDTIDCIPVNSWTYDVEITIFKDNHILYKGMLYDYYQTLLLWVTPLENGS